MSQLQFRDLRFADVVEYLEQKYSVAYKGLKLVPKEEYSEEEKQVVMLVSLDGKDSITITEEDLESLEITKSLDRVHIPGTTLQKLLLK